mmetsp:Transcript_118758/g.335992  ORF Transcript_118758/g.335992 Transcript_118758/m.335992 type:complete len:288 (+) Transcript_118758:780-1643(+)
MRPRLFFVWPGPSQGRPALSAALPDLLGRLHARARTSARVVLRIAVRNRARIRIRVGLAPTGRPPRSRRSTFLPPTVARPLGRLPLLPSVPAVLFPFAAAPDVVRLRPGVIPLRLLLPPLLFSPLALPCRAGGSACADMRSRVHPVAPPTRFARLVCPGGVSLTRLGGPRCPALCRSARRRGLSQEAGRARYSSLRQLGMRRPLCSAASMTEASRSGVRVLAHAEICDFSVGMHVRVNLIMLVARPSQELVLGLSCTEPTWSKFLRVGGQRTRRTAWAERFCVGRQV